MSYLGYIISKDGLCASEERVQAILQYATPTDLKQLESFVGKLNYYGKFLPAFASVCAPLNQLRCKDTSWKWSAECAAAFDELKQMLADKTRLVHFDPEMPIVLATDASPYGIGAVISHVLHDGSEEPIAFASKTLSKAERSYAQVEKEGLSIVYGIRKFNQYLSGRHFTILTDHTPLLTIFGPDKSLPAMSLQRLQRWALLLMGHDYDIRYRASAEHCNADALSRLPAGPDVAFDREEEVRAITSEVQQIATEVVNKFPITWKLVAECTKKDTVLSQVLNFVRLADLCARVQDGRSETILQHADGDLSSERRHTTRLSRGSTTGASDQGDHHATPVSSRSCSHEDDGTTVCLVAEHRGERRSLL